MGLWFALICWGSCIGWFTGSLVGLRWFVVAGCCFLWRFGLGGVALAVGCCVAWVVAVCLVLIGIRAMGLVVLVVVDELVVVLIWWVLSCCC